MERRQTKETHHITYEMSDNQFVRLEQFVKFSVCCGVSWPVAKGTSTYREYIHVVSYWLYSLGADEADNIIADVISRAIPPTRPLCLNSFTI